MKRPSFPITRRDFLRACPRGRAGAAAFPTIVGASALGRNGAVPPSDRIVMAGVGFGMQGGSQHAVLPAEKRGPMGRRLRPRQKPPGRSTRASSTAHYGNTSCATYGDYRQLCLRAATSTPFPSPFPTNGTRSSPIACLRRGWDVYGEKPLSHSLAEGRAICEAVRRYGRVWQTGSWQRSVDDFHRACELVRNGRIGKILRVEVGLPSGHTDFAGTFGQEQLTSPPPELDYETWLGPAPYWPYCEARVHMNWRWNMDFGGGQLMDWIGHHLDIAHWGLGFDHTGPVEIRGTGEFPTPESTTARPATGSKPSTPTAPRSSSPGATMKSRAERNGSANTAGSGWTGTGSKPNPPTLSRKSSAPTRSSLTRSRDHSRNFLEAVREPGPTIAPAETAHRSASVGHLGVIAIETGRKITWDPDTETIVGDPEAARLLGRAYRKPYILPG